MATIVQGSRHIEIRMQEKVTDALGISNRDHVLVYPGDLRSETTESGTTSSTQDRVYSARLTLTATTTALDFAGGVVDLVTGAAITMVEIRGICIINRATTAAGILLLGAGSTPAFVGFFGATGDIIKIPAGGCFFWEAPIDAGGLTVTGASADILTIDSGAQTVTFDIMVWGVSA